MRSGRKRAFSPLLGIWIFVLAGLFARAQLEVSGMRQYVDKSFGFSFWYPATWKIPLNQGVSDPTEDGWFRGGQILKELRIINPAASGENGQPPGVVLREVRAPGGLTELGASRSASPVGVDQKYFFSARTHRWIYSQLSELPSGEPPATYPAKITRRTMGGLPIFMGAERHAAEVIVPLDASRFLAISTMDPGGDDNQTYLADTVVATNPSLGKRASAHVQAETIRQEAVQLARSY